MPNVSELARLEGEMLHLKGCFRAGLYRDKASKEHLLGEIRSVARQLGESVPNYNSEEFDKWLRQ